MAVSLITAPRLAGGAVVCVTGAGVGLGVTVTSGRALTAGVGGRLIDTHVDTRR